MYDEMMIWTIENVYFQSFILLLDGVLIPSPGNLGTEEA